MYWIAKGGAAVELSRGTSSSSRWLEETGIRVAHELRNALCAVRVLAQLGQRNPAEAASHERLARIEAEVARMEEVLREQLARARDAEPARAALRTG